MEERALPNLATCLQATTWRWLLLMAESQHLPSTTRWSKAELMEALQPYLLDPLSLTAILSQESVPVQTLLTTMLRANGGVLAQTLMASYGQVRPASDWYRGLAQVYLQASPLERLFALGLLYFDPPRPKPGILQRIVLPAELLPILQRLAPTTLGSQASHSLQAPPALLPRPGQPPDLAWHMALWLATITAEPRPCWRGGWLLPSVLARLNLHLQLDYPKVALRSERKTPYLAFLHYLACAAELIPAQETLALTPQAWQWLAADSATRWQALWQAWRTAPPELAYPFHYPIQARGTACFPWPRLTPAARTDLCAKVSQLSLETFTPVTQLAERIKLDDAYRQWGNDEQATEQGIAALCAGPLFWLGVVDLAVGDAGERESQGDKGTRDKEIRDKEERDPIFGGGADLTSANLLIRLTARGAWLLGLPGWGAPHFPKPILCEAPAKEPDVFWVSATTQPLHLARLAPLCEWSSPAGITTDQRLQLDAARIGVAVAKGVQPAQLFQILTEATGVPPSRRQSQRLRRWIQAGQQVRIRPLVVLETTDAKLMGQLRSRKLVRRQLDAVLSPTRSTVHPAGIAALVQTLHTLNLYTQPPADFAENLLADSAPASDGVGAQASLLWMLAQIYQGLGAHVTLPLALPDRWLDALHRQLTFAQQATAESAAQQLLEQLDLALRGYLRLPAWRLVEQQGNVLASIKAALAAEAKPDLWIAYWAADNAHKTVRRITPYALETRDKILYVTAYCHLREQERLFRIDRIESCEVVDGRP